ncbi:MAG TPA: 5-formyltetrahydrofolate cyclo-ligase [Candidatus Peribacterales bacterium]|nr:5-formyltetrahydrofolate cyclo-ligase [Candidatus Peribacterales bacterium]
MKSKDQLREAIAGRIAAMKQSERAAESRSICRRVLEELPPSLDGICLYVPLKTEVDIADLTQELRSKNIPLYLPRFAANILEFRRWDDDESLIKGALNIPEPPLSAPLLPAQGTVLVVVPGRAFDQKGGRLGRGNGGYDRFIHSYRSMNQGVIFWGICFECQMVREVPLEAHDERVDAVITARGRQLG